MQLLWHGLLKGKEKEEDLKQPGVEKVENEREEGGWKSLEEVRTGNTQETNVHTIANEYFSLLWEWPVRSKAQDKFFKIMVDNSKIFSLWILN